MNEVFSGSLYFGFFLSLFAYYLGIKIRKVFRLGIFNPLLVAIVLIIVFLSVTKIPYEEYKDMKTVEIAQEVKSRIEKVIKENEKN